MNCLISSPGRNSLDHTSTGANLRGDVILQRSILGCSWQTMPDLLLIRFDVFAILIDFQGLLMLKLSNVISLRPSAVLEATLHD